jgi:hypothetical protein
MKAPRFFLLFCLCAVVPLVAAQLSLKFGWFSQAFTNKGIWMDKEVQLLPDLLVDNTAGSESTKVHWRLVYLQAENCDRRCEQAMLTLQQLYSGLGRKQLKIKPLVMEQRGAEAGIKQEREQAHRFPDLDWQSGEINIPELINNIVIVNQRGLVLLRYPVTGTPEQMQNLAKNIRADLLHLINYDRAGA